MDSGSSRGSKGVAEALGASRIANASARDDEVRVEFKLSLQPSRAHIREHITDNLRYFNGPSHQSDFQVIMPIRERLTHDAIQV